MLPGFHKRQINVAHNTVDIEDQEQATPKASTVDTISNLDNGKILKWVTMSIMLLKAMLL